MKMKVLGSLAGMVSSATKHLSKIADRPSGDGDGASGMLGKVGGTVKDKVGGAAKEVASSVGFGSPGSDETRVTNIIEQLDIGAPINVVYTQWTAFEDFPGFMKKVEHVEQESEEKLTWKAQILWSHRTWQSEIIEQVPDERIVWRSQGDKGHVDGVVTFHELAPSLTRVILVLEYHPQGFFEHVGNLWRAQGRRARLEFKHFGRHVMTRTLLNPDEVEGWRGEIHDGEVVSDGETSDETSKDETPDESSKDETSDESSKDSKDSKDESSEEGDREKELESSAH